MKIGLVKLSNMTYDEFKKTCYHTRSLLRIPVLRTSIEKVNLMTKGKYDLKKEDKALKKLYEINNVENMKIK